MKYCVLIIFFMLFIESQCQSQSISCADYHAKKLKDRIISNIKAKLPGINKETMRDLYYKVLLCVTGSYQTFEMIEKNLYRVIYRIIFKGETDLTSIHKKYCNSGKESGITLCISILGDSYPCAALMDSFGPCSNDYNFNDGL